MESETIREQILNLFIELYKRPDLSSTREITRLLESDLPFYEGEPMRIAIRTFSDIETGQPETMARISKFGAKNYYNCVYTKEYYSTKKNNFSELFNIIDNEIKPTLIEIRMESKQKKDPFILDFVNKLKQNYKVKISYEKEIRLFN